MQDLILRQPAVILSKLADYLVMTTSEIRRFFYNDNRRNHTVLRHMKILVNANLVTEKQVGTRMKFTITDEGKEIAQYFKRIRDLT